MQLYKITERGSNRQKYYLKVFFSSILTLWLEFHRVYSCLKPDHCPQYLSLISVTYKNDKSVYFFLFLLPTEKKQIAPPFCSPNLKCNTDFHVQALSCEQSKKNAEGAFKELQIPHSWLDANVIILDLKGRTSKISDEVSVSSKKKSKLTIILPSYTFTLPVTGFGHLPCR